MNPYCLPHTGLSISQDTMFTTEHQVIETIDQETQIKADFIESTITSWYKGKKDTYFSTNSTDLTSKILALSNIYYF